MGSGTSAGDCVSDTYGMAFVQIMTFEMDEIEAVRLLNEYAEEGRGKTFARRAIIGRDRSEEGRLVQIIFFDSAQDAEANNELAVTQRNGAEFNELASEVKFVDVNVVADITI